MSQDELQTIYEEYKALQLRLDQDDALYKIAKDTGQSYGDVLPPKERRKISGRLYEIAMLFNQHPEQVRALKGGKANV